MHNNGIENVWASGLYVDGASHLIVENNLVYDNTGPGLVIGQETKESTTENVIVRHNVSWNNHYAVFAPSPHDSRNGRVLDSVLVHNVYHGTKGGQAEMHLGRGENNVFKNNIFYTENSDSQAILREADNADTTTWTFDYNAYAPIMSSSKMMRINQTWFSDFNSYQTATAKDSNSLNIVEPQFVDKVNRDYHLAQNSLLIDQGDFLSKTSSDGNGTEIAVEDSRFFTNRWGLMEGDVIQVGTNEPVKIVNVNYINHTISIDKNISWNINEGVSYAYSGNKPDIGRYEYESEAEPIPNKPTNLTDKNVTEYTVTLEWEDNSTNETGFEIFRNNNIIHITEVNATTYTVTGLTAYTTYTFKVRAKNSSGYSDFAAINVTTHDMPPAAPSDLNESNKTTDSVQLNWTDNSANETGFEICDINDTLIDLTDINTTSYIVLNLEPNTEYTFKVRAKNDFGYSDFISINTTTEKIPPDAPSDINFTNITSGSVTLNWTDNSDDPNSETGFKIFRDDVLIYTTEINTTSYIDNNLSANTTYSYTVKATND